MNAPELTMDARITAFAAAVRAELTDLPVDEVDDLVDGLEADLAEQASETDEFALPDAAEYAAELRAAAGLPPRAPDAPTPAVPLRERLERSRAAAARRIRSSQGGAWLIDFFVALRPAWWVLRGWILYTFTIPLTGNALMPMSNVGAFLIFIAAVVLSVQWGRGRWLPTAWLRVVRTVVNVAAVVLAPFLIGAAIAAIYTLPSVEYISDDQPGMVVDGERVRNIFAYDADGNPLTDVQLFDQDGRPLTTVGGDTAASEWDDYFAYGGGPVPVPLIVPGRAPVWNVFPLQELPANEDPETANPHPAVPHFLRVPAVDRPHTEPDPTPGASTDATPSATPGPTP